MRILEDGLYLCVDCTLVECSGIRGTSLEGTPRGAEVLAALAKLGERGHAAPAFDSETGQGMREFSSMPCAACGDTLAGYRAEFALLGE